MRTYDVRVSNREISISDQYIVQNNVSVDQIRPHFDEEWEGFNVSAIFYKESSVDLRFSMGVNEDETYDIPWELLQDLEPICLSFVGYSDTDRIVTIMSHATFEVQESGLLTGAKPNTPTIDQIEGMLKDIAETLKHANDTADKLDETVEGAEEATQAANEAAEEARQAAQTASSAANEANAINDAIQAAEALRVEAENQRNENEQQRESKELERQSAEEQRIEAEETRKSQEESREEAESLRDIAESERDAAERLRDTSETERNEAEQAREAAEQRRQEDTAKAIAATEAATEKATQAAKRAEQAEADTKAAEELRVEAEKGRVEAEEKREAAEAERKLQQSKNNADQAANNQAAMGLQFQILTAEQYDPETLQPNIEGSVGKFYLTPYDKSEGTDLYAEWIWVVESERFERVGNTAMSVDPITTGQIDQVVDSGTDLLGEELLKASGLSYYDKKRKTANDATYATKSEIPTDYLTSDDLEPYATSQSVTEGLALKADQTALGELEGTLATKADQTSLNAAKQELGEQISELESTTTEALALKADSAEVAETYATKVSIETDVKPHLVPNYPLDKPETKYLNGSGEWVEVKGSGGGGGPFMFEIPTQGALKDHLLCYYDDGFGEPPVKVDERGHLLWSYETEE